MQPLLMRVSRTALDSNRTSIALRVCSSQTSLFASPCIQCCFRAQRRHFASDTKPDSPNNPPSNPSAPLPIYTSPSLSTTPVPELPSAQETRRSATSKRLSSLMDNLQGNIFLASQRLNDLTGYSGIESLKTQIMVLEGALASYQDAVRQSRLKYKTTVAERAASQREVTTLLARKDTWSAADLERFTALYRSDHGNEQAVQEAATRLADCEREAEQAATQLSSSILSRYHEEQIWSDKIRRMSTWGTWGLMGVNVLLFFVFQFGFEPWRRARLVSGFEEKVREALEKEKEKNSSTSTGRDPGIAVAEAGGRNQAALNGIVEAGIQELEEEVFDDPKIADPAVDMLATVIRSKTTPINQEPPSAQDPVLAASLRKPETWKPALIDLFSERTISMSKQDVTITALEGAATGAAFVGIIAIFMLRPR